MGVGEVKPFVYKAFKIDDCSHIGMYCNETGDQRELLAKLEDLAHSNGKLITQNITKIRGSEIDKLCWNGPKVGMGRLGGWADGSSSEEATLDYEVPL